MQTCHFSVSALSPKTCVPHSDRVRQMRILRFFPDSTSELLHVCTPTAGLTLFQPFRVMVGICVSHYVCVSCPSPATLPTSLSFDSCPKSVFYFPSVQAAVPSFLSLYSSPIESVLGTRCFVSPNSSIDPASQSPFKLCYILHSLSLCLRLCLCLSVSLSVSSLSLSLSASVSLSLSVSFCLPLSASVSLSLSLSLSLCLCLSVCLFLSLSLMFVK